MSSEKLLTHPEASRFHYGYVIVAGAFVVAAVVEGLLSCFGVFFKPLFEEFGWSRSMTSGAFSLAALLHIPQVVITGRLTDRFGSRPMLAICGFFLGLGYLLMSCTTAVWHLYAFYGIISSIGMGFYWVPLVTLVPRWFVQKRALMMGIVTSGVGVGQVVFPPLATWLITTHGWRASFLIMGVASMVVIMGAAQLLRRPQNPSESSVPDKQEKESAQTTHKGQELPLSRAVRTKEFWMISGIFFFFLYSLGVVFVHAVIHFIGLGLSAVMAANMIAVMALMGIMGRVILGRAADRIGNKAVSVIASAFMVVGYVFIAFGRSLGMIIAFAVVFGVAYGTMEVIHAPMIAERFGLRSLGAVSGASLALAIIGLVIGPTLTGYVYDVTHSYQAAFLICALMGVASFLSAFLLPKPGSQIHIRGEG